MLRLVPRFHLRPSQLVLVLWLALFWCSLSGELHAQASDPITTRIVTLVPNATELLFAMGAGGQVVGVSDFCQYPDEARTRPRVGGLINPSLEKVLTLRPTVVVLYRSQGDFAGKLKSLGVNTCLLSMDSLSDLNAALSVLGGVSGCESEADRIASEIRTGLDKVRAAAVDTKTSMPRRGVVIVSRKSGTLRSMYQAAEGNFLGELFVIAGGQLAIPSDPPVTAESIIRANPDLILDMTSGETGETSAPVKAEPGAWATLNTVNAVKNGRIYHWHDPHRMLLGPGVVETARQFQKVIHNSNFP